MAEELKPCPFCGGEEVYVEEYEHHPGAVRWRVLCAGCMAGIDTGTRQSAGDAVLDWNRRAERTCRVEVERRKLSQTQTAVVKTCSECGFEFGVEKENTFPFEVTLNVVVPPSYCPNCGARIVEEES